MPRTPSVSERLRSLVHRLRRASPRPLPLVAAAAAAVALVALSVDPTAAADAGDDEAAFLVALNEVRVEQGLAPLQVHAELAGLAREHAAAMAAAGDIFHADPISAGFESPWRKLGENVGVGANVDVLVDAFVASPGHYANIIDPAFTHIGIGVVWDGDALYTAHRFLEPEGATPVPSTTVPSTTPPTTSEPVPTPEGQPSAPGIGPDRVVALLELLELIGT